MSETTEQYCAECGMEIVDLQFAAYGTQGIMCDMQCVKKNAEKSGNDRWIEKVNEVVEFLNQPDATIH